MTEVEKATKINVALHQLASEIINGHEGIGDADANKIYETIFDFIHTAPHKSKVKLFDIIANIDF